MDGVQLPQGYSHFEEAVEPQAIRYQSLSSSDLKSPDIL